MGGRGNPVGEDFFKVLWKDVSFRGMYREVGLDSGRLNQQQERGIIFESLPKYKGFYNLFVSLPFEPRDEVILRPIPCVVLCYCLLVSIP